MYVCMYVFIYFYTVVVDLNKAGNKSQLQGGTTTNGTTDSSSNAADSQIASPCAC
jgi:hypothetical protein